MENNSKKRLISFSSLNKYFIIPFISPIINAIHYHLYKYIFFKKEIEFKNRNFFLLNYDFFSIILGNGIPFFISLYLQRKDKDKDDLSKKNDTSKSAIKLIYYNELGKKRSKQFIFVIIMSLIYTSADIFVNFYNTEEQNYFDTRFNTFLFIFIWSKLILKTRIFRHHIFSLFFCFIGFIIYSVHTFKIFKKDDIICNFYYIIYCIFYSLFLVLIKYTTCYLYISPYLCLLYIGLFSFIISWIGFSIYSLIKYHNFSFISDAFDLSEVENKKQFYFFYFICLFIFSLTQILFTFIIYFFSPNLYMVTEILRSILINIIENIQKKYDKTKQKNDPNVLTTSDRIFQYIGSIILLFAILIFNEIIILNFFGLNKNTTSLIEERENKEIMMIEDKFSESDEDNEDNSRKSSSLGIL